MSRHDRFRYKSLGELKEDLARLGIDLPISENLSVLSRPVEIGSGFAPNRLAIDPMEGCDGTPDGRPSDLTRRRYSRFGEGGAGLVWFEATAVVNEGRANPRQLQINAETAPDIAAALGQMLAASKAAGHGRPYSVVQLTHSGRYSKPVDAPAPIVAARNPFLDAGRPEGRVISDEESTG